MQITGHNLIGHEAVAGAGGRYSAVDPSTGAEMGPEFADAGPEQVARAATLAASALPLYSQSPRRTRAAFLRTIGKHLNSLGDELLLRAHAETALPIERLRGERLRAVRQLDMFADLVEEGSWVDARIDPALPHREGGPRPDLRRMLVPLGPIAVFGASNFPLAFSVAGGDTASALAAGCPVIAKAHPGHPGTSELAGRAVLGAAAEVGIPEGAFSLLHGASNTIGTALVTDPRVKAVAFTGSLSGGRAIFDAAAARDEPIPVFAEMGSLNPVFLLAGAIRERAEMIASGLAASVTLGAGQFCTNPGLVFLVESPESEQFVAALSAKLLEAPVGTFVHSGIKRAFDASLSGAAALDGVAVSCRVDRAGAHAATDAPPALLVTDGSRFAEHPELHTEVFGPATIAVVCESDESLLTAARSLRGQLTATVHGTDGELEQNAPLVAILAEKVGRIVFNGFPTGVEVAPAMHHGGPYPATTDSRATSVGTAAILRFARPVCYQNAAQSILPPELRDENPLGIWRLVDGRPSREAL